MNVNLDPLVTATPHITSEELPVTGTALLSPRPGWYSCLHAYRHVLTVELLA